MVAEHGGSSEMSANLNSSEASPSRQITVVDVYDLASAIGKDFEALIDHYGTDCVRELMPKVISALETLEALASRNDRENEEIVSLKKTVERLEVDKVERIQGRQKFERELEQIEDNYRREIKELWEMVQKLQEENKRLNTNLSSQKDLASPVQTLKEEDLKVMLNLKDSVDQLREHMKVVQTENEEKKQELETLQLQVEKLTRVNKELSRKNKTIQNQSRILVEEKSELISQLQKCETHLIQLEHQLGETEKARKDLEQTKTEGGQGENVPRFTLAELREVLQEKNSLKARVMELEEELELLRPSATPSPQPPPKEEDEELLVYGPMPREPEDKLYPWKYERKDSGVRKFFRKLRGQKGPSAAPPRPQPMARSSTSPAAMARACSSSASSSRTPPAGTTRPSRPATPAAKSPPTRSSPLACPPSGAEEEEEAFLVTEEGCEVPTPIEFSLDTSSSSPIAYFSVSRNTPPPPSASEAVMPVSELASTPGK